MIPVTVSYTTIQWGSADPNWGSDEFLYEEYGKNEYKSEEEHSKQVYDWEILQLFFLHHNLDPNFYLTYEEDKVRQVKINRYLDTNLCALSKDLTNSMLKGL